MAASAHEVTSTLPIGAVRGPAALALMAASGFAGLGCQIVWTQQSAVWLGHEAAAVLAVVAAFFGGLAAGALVLGRRIERSRRPARWYAACEALIGVWSIALAFLIAPASRGLLDLLGAQPSALWQGSVAFGGTFALLLPATAAMGATLPAMERVLAQLRREGSSIAALYAGNTLGATFGVLAAAFWLVPEFGLVRTSFACATLNLLCAAGALVLFGAEVAVNASSTAPMPTPLALMLAATGLLGIGYEVLVVRVLSQVAESTVYTFALLLAIYLVGTALGAAIYERWRRRMHSADTVRDRLLQGLAAACLLGTAGLWGAEAIKASASRALGGSLAAALAGEAAIAAVAFLLPTLVMGALFSHLCTGGRAAGIGFGRAIGVNTLGAAAAPLLFGVLLVPALGPKLALLLVAAGYLLLAARHALRAPIAWAIAAAGIAMAIWTPPLAFIDIPDGGRVVSYRDGAMAAVSVVEDAGGVLRLRINNRAQEGTSATRVADVRQALLPLLLHPDPRRALFLGLGTGVTASAAAEDAQLQVDAVELLPEVIAASRYFTPSDAESARGARPRVIAADARRFVRAADQRYDVIVSDNFHPARSGSGALYTVEHFGAVRARLVEGGLFCQWLPLHQLDLDTLRSIVRAFVAAYPGAWALLATNSLDTPVLGLVAHGDGARFEVGRVRERMTQAARHQDLPELGIYDEFAVLGSFVAGPRALARFAEGAAINTDDHPVVAYVAPRITYAPDSVPRDRLVELLRQLDLQPAELIAVAPDDPWAARLAAYWTARNRYLDVGRRVQASGDVRRMLSQVREPLLSVLRISPDFRPAYDPLLRMARAVGQTDAAAARALLTELMQAQPARPEAAQLLRTLAEPGP